MRVEMVTVSRWTGLTDTRHTGTSRKVPSAAEELSVFMHQGQVSHLMPLVVEAIGADPLQQLHEIDSLTTFYAEATVERTSVIWLVAGQLLTRLEINQGGESMTVHIPLSRIRRLQVEKRAAVQRTVIEFDADRVTVMTVAEFTRHVPATYTLELPSTDPNVGRLVEFTRKLSQALP